MVASRLFLAAGVLLLAGCGNGDSVSRAFGLTRDAPDEFTVTTRAPLSMPPDYTLRPPRPGADRPQELTPRQGAEAALAPQSVLTGPQSGEISPGQQALVAAAGPPAPADIRRRVDADAALAETDRSFADKLLFWKGPEDKSVALDAQAESQRLRGNAALGQTATTGDTPIIQRPKETFWNSLF